MRKINLVLSGGGARGLAHLGVVKALRENGFTIQAISGVSSGAIAGAFIAKGMEPDEILDIVLSTKCFNISRLPFSLGPFSKKNIRQVLQKYFGNSTFNDLNIPLIVSATNINTCNTDYFDRGSLVMPLIASSALPILFAPVELNGYQYLDGGMVNNLPVEPFLNDPIPRFGVNVNIINGSEPVSSTLRIFERAIQISVAKNVEQRKPHFDFLIEPKQLCNFTSYDLSKPRDIFNVGYEYAKKVLEKFVNENEKGFKLSEKHAA